MRKDESELLQRFFHLSNLKQLMNVESIPLFLFVTTRADVGVIAIEVEVHK